MAGVESPELDVARTQEYCPRVSAGVS
ncbi:MAG: hypothetical protein RLZZ17_528, partial [Actinomycetota bacterium]